jgi:hypothetical protein
MTEKKINTSNKEVKGKQLIADQNELVTKEDVFVDDKTAKPIKKVEVLDSIRFMSVDNIVTLQNYIYEANKEAIDLFIMLDNALVNNKVVKQSKE